MGRIRHKRTHHARRDVSRGARTRARHLDADQREAILLDPAKKNAMLQPDHLDVEKPGLGLFYCIECDRHFPTEGDRAVHIRSKLHKRIAKRMHEEKAYTVEESMRAAGIGIDNRQRTAEQAVTKGSAPDSAMTDTTHSTAAQGTATPASAQLAQAPVARMTRSQATAEDLTSL